MRNRRATVLFEMMFTVMLIAALAVIAERLFSLTAKLCADAPQQQEVIIRHESAVEALREDAWGAQAFTADADGSVRIEGGAVRWSVDPNGDAVRIDQHKTRRWADGFGKATLSIDGPCIVIGSESDGVRLISQVQLFSANHGRL